MDNYYNLTINKWDLIFYSVSDPIIIIYFVIPVWLYFSIVLILRDWNYNLLIRTRSFSKWMSYTSIELYGKLFLFQFFWVVTTLVLSRGIPFEFGWSSYALNEQALGNYSYTLQTIGLHPTIVLLLHMLLLSLFLIMLHLSLTTVYVITLNLPTIVVLGVLYFIGGLISFRMIPHWMIWFKIENFVILASAHLAWDTLLYAFLVPVALVAIFYIIVIFAKSFYHLLKHFLRDRYVLLSYIILCLLGILLQQNNETVTIWDTLYAQFYGVSTEGFYFPFYLFYCLVFFGAAYLFQSMLVKNSEGAFFLEWIRYGSYSRWFTRLILKAMAKMGLLLVGFGIVTLLVSILKGNSIESIVTLTKPSIQVSQLSYHFFVNGLLQLLNYYLIIFIIFCLWNNASANILIFGALFVICLPMININQFFPIGLNSFGYLTDNITDMYKISTYLLAWSLMQIMIILFIFKRKR
ncbi:hypothetical protein ACFOQM_07895 [Paenibacillus sp. GCM10012307]|uniref:Permease n=1 Tax=Paenibacillus roseus TaxID=2798579 RepID=A0A934J6I5_9BACL|nr:hypothetical protein [Paenibacillus roseus]MBJ6361213.1 hypothetical protein [Paenibacillus roseus]